MNRFVINNNQFSVSLRPKVTCPHCWTVFSSEDVRWVSTHPDLLGDPLLGDEAASRFLPTLFTSQGNAIDVRGSVCQDIACPECHLSIPRVILELPERIISIAGTPSCGKSYFLASAAWALRNVMPQKFQLSFADADPLSNQVLNHYEEQQFLNPDRDAIVRLAKTEEQGDLYSTVRLNDRTVLLPKPFMFSIKPTSSHPGYEESSRISRLLCLYDNAGESFLPGKDTADNLVTRHLLKSNAILFLFDPTQDVRFRESYSKVSNASTSGNPVVSSRQETILHEIVARVKKHTKQTAASRKRPLIIVLTKYDEWWPLIGHERLPDPWSPTQKDGQCALNLTTIQKVSDTAQKIVGHFSPELVATASGFSDSVWYIPISATGCQPEQDPDSKRWGIRPRNINPMWPAIPLLLALALKTKGLIPTTQPRAKVAAAKANRKGVS